MTIKWKISKQFIISFGKLIRGWDQSLNKSYPFHKSQNIIDQCNVFEREMKVSSSRGSFNWSQESSGLRSLRENSELNFERVVSILYYLLHTNVNTHLY